MKNFINEFKAFAMKGNVVDLAVGIIIGAAFGKIVSSLVSDVIMPPIGFLIGGVDFTDLKVTLVEKTADAAAVSINYGMFLQTVFDFTIVAFAVFMAIKAMNRLKKSDEVELSAPAEPVAPPADIQLLTEIRDLLKK